MKNRRKYRKACGDKAKYSKMAAAQTAFILSNRLHTLITSYLCRYCGRWHIGHPPARIRELVLEQQAAACSLRKRSTMTHYYDGPVAERRRKKSNKRDSNESDDDKTAAEKKDTVSETFPVAFTL